MEGWEGGQVGGEEGSIAPLLHQVQQVSLPIHLQIQQSMRGENSPTPPPGSAGVSHHPPTDTAEYERRE